MPLMELGLAARALQDRSRPVRLGAWRRRALTQLTDPERHVLSLIPPIGWSPTFLVPPVSGSAAEAIERARATPSREIRAELAALAERQAMPRWTQHLADDPDLRRQVYDAVAKLYETLLGPYWNRMTPQFASDRLLCMRQFLTGGVEYLLSQVNPRWTTWNPPVLEIQMANCVEFDLHLEGRGVLLVPSLWSTRTLVDSDARPQPVVTYPVRHDDPLGQLTALGLEPDGIRPDEPVRKLLGHTRAAVLHTIAEHPGCTTTELATTTHIAVASASEHATVLREAGLIRTIRHRNTALHSPTPLGLALLNGR